MLSLFAQTAAPTTGTAWWNSGAMAFMIEGGLWFMIPILFLAILGLAVVIERFRSLRLISANAETLRREVFDLLYKDKVEEAIDLCLRSRGPAPAILAVGLHRYELARRLGYDSAAIEEQVDKAMEEYGTHVTAVLERHMPILATIANIAPMLGSIGTIAGMIVLFKGLAAMPETARLIKVAAEGIQMKLIVTLFGLMVGVPAYIFYTYFNTVINRLVLEAEETASKMIEALTVRMAPGGSPAKAERPADYVA